MAYCTSGTSDSSCTDGALLVSGKCTACHTNTGVKTCKAVTAVTDHETCLDGYVLSTAGTCTACAGGATLASECANSTGFPSSKCKANAYIKTVSSVDTCTTCGTDVATCTGKADKSAIDTVDSCVSGKGKSDCTEDCPANAVACFADETKADKCEDGYFLTDTFTCT